jgi:hypothetical protein
MDKVQKHNSFNINTPSSEFYKSERSSYLIGIEMNCLHATCFPPMFVWAQFLKAVKSLFLVSKKCKDIMEKEWNVNSEEHYKHWHS